MSLSDTERMELITMRGYGDRVRSYAEVVNLFNNTHPNRNPISRSTVQRTVTRFEQTGAVKDRPRNGRPKSAANDNRTVEILQSVMENPHLSVRKIAQANDISKSSTHRILKKERYHSYKIMITQELTISDFDKRIEFCEEIMNRYDQNNNFLDYLIFSDEATFQLNGAVNRHNCRYWIDENPYWMCDLRTQYPEKVNVWAGLCHRGIIGPFFIDGNLNAAKYLNLLQNQIIPAIENLFAEDMQNVWFLQDGATPHYALVVRQFLDRTFPNKWIGRKGAIEWPPRSPDMSPLNYFLWGHLKNNVYVTKPHSLEELRKRILHEAELVTLEQIRNVLSNFYVRLGQCQIVRGRQFEHLLN